MGRLGVFSGYRGVYLWVLVLSLILVVRFVLRKGFVSLFFLVKGLFVKYLVGVGFVFSSVFVFSIFEFV